MTDSAGNLQIELRRQVLLAKHELNADTADANPNCFAWTLTNTDSVTTVRRERRRSRQDSVG